MRKTILGLVTALATLTANAAELAPVADFDPADYRGKVLYVDFWASWCAPCRASFPWMNEMLSKYADDGLEIVAISVDEKRSAAEKFLERYPADFQVFLDAEGKLAKQYELPGMPSSFLFGRDGKLIKRHLGFRAKDKPGLEQLIAETLGTAPAAAPEAGQP